MDGKGNDVPFDVEAHARVLVLIAKIFDVKPWEEGKGGLTVEQMFMLQTEYLVYMNELKKKRDRLQQSLRRSAGKSSEPTPTTPPEQELSSTPTTSQNDKLQLP